MAPPAAAALAGLAALSLAPIAMSGPRAAHAGPPFSVTGFIAREGNGYVLDEGALDAFLVEALGAVRPRHRGTGDTVGPAGLELTLGLGWAPVSPRSSAWRGATDDPPGALTPLLFGVRKGIATSIELGAQLGWSSELEVASPALELRWSFIEGQPGLPDLGLRLDVGALVGNPDVTVVHGGVDLVIGKSLPIQGLFTLGPYGGYAFRFGRTIERQIAWFEGDESDDSQTLLPGQNLFLHHALIGLRIEAKPLLVVIEAQLGTSSGVEVALGAAF